jgi:alginate O-acetyltransferase complex protein AlgI
MLLISILTWRIFIQQSKAISIEDKVALSLIFLFPFTFSILKFTGLTEISFISDIPQIHILLIIPGLIIIFLYIFSVKNKNKSLLAGLITIFLTIILIILKNQTLSKNLSIFFRQLSGQSTSLASPVDIVWLGFSYFAFRLIHILVDRERIFKLGLSLRDFITYLIFFPAFTAGPIDRIEHFNIELNKPEEKTLNDDFLVGGLRIIRGLFQKFILADSLALISLNSQSAALVNKPIWMWISLYAFSLRIFFDFSGYTDIAIGIAKLAGISLPENFRSPYLSKNITLFWNNWHITLTQWFRTYYFNPVTRYIRSNYKDLSPVLIIFFTQISTMVLIGLWHGISWNFVIWGLWNGIGLFFHNRWAESVKPKISIIKDKPFLAPYNIFSTILTFNFVSLGWVWFALPSVGESILVFTKLF